MTDEHFEQFGKCVYCCREVKPSTAEYRFGVCDDLAHCQEHRLPIESGEWGFNED